MKTIKINDCVLLKRNPQYLTPHQMDSLARSIERDGFLVPIVVQPLRNGKFRVVSGNHRLQAAKRAGLRSVSAVLTHLGERAIKRLIVNLNTVHGDLNAELLAPFLAELNDDTLKTVYLDNSLMDDLMKFDETLFERLKQLEAPENIDRESSPNSLPTCQCPRCGKKHAPVSAPESSK